MNEPTPLQRASFITLIAYCVLCAISLVYAVEIEVSGTPIYTLRWRPDDSGHYAGADTVESDTVWGRRDSGYFFLMHQTKFVYFDLPTSVARCDSWYIAVWAYNLSEDPPHGRTGISMTLYPRDSTDITPFFFSGWEGDDWWKRFYTLDTIPYGALWYHRTYEGTDAYNRYILNRDYPGANRIIMAIEPELGPACHLIVSASLFWTADTSTGTTTIYPWIASSPDLSVYPNPFNNEATIQYALPSPALVEMDVFDVTGRLVNSLLNVRQSAGIYALSFDGSALPSGSYFVSLRAGDQTIARKIVLLK